jgi:hypothetical protein
MLAAKPTKTIEEQSQSDARAALKAKIFNSKPNDVQCSPLAAYVIARSHEHHKDPELANEWYDYALEKLRDSDCGYDFNFAKMIAESFIVLLHRQHNVLKAKMIENEFCNNVCRNPWKQSRVSWTRYTFALPEGIGEAVLDVRLAHER